MSLHTELCDAIVTRLLSQSWTPNFTAARRWPSETQAWKTETGELENLQVSVVPQARTQEIITRGQHSQRIYLAAIVMQKAMELADKANLDPLDTLSEAITDFLRPSATDFKALTLASGSRAEWHGVDVDPVYDEESMVKRQQYMGVQVHAYVVVK